MVASDGGDGGAIQDGEARVAGNGSCVEHHLVDDDTKVYPTEVVYKPSLFVFYYLKRLST